MVATRLLTFLLLATITIGQQAPASKSATSGIPEPELPVIDYNACPGKGRIVPRVRIRRNDRIYSSWQDKRALVGALKAGEEVTVLAGVNVIREPDRALVKQGITDSSLKLGDEVLGYGLHGDGYYDFWAKGVWFLEYFEVIAGKGDMCGFADKSQCTIVITKNGVKEWWLEVKTSNGRTGWVLARKFTGDKFLDSGNFDELCGD
ncbi:MAG TPA: hypothetical protein VN948_15865 [Terriglobales bacterium]|nr:hypothetical protein [Terriglobales bacterium]